MSSIKSFVRKLFPNLFYWNNALRTIRRHYVEPLIRTKYKYCHTTALLEPPFQISDYSLVSIGPYTKIRSGFTFLGSSGRLTIKKYATLAMNCCIVTNGHVPTVGLPHIISGTHHINDKSTDITIHEAVWIGLNVTLLPGSEIGRGAIVGAGSVVNKYIPPYAVAVGIPAKIIATAFTLDQIIEHEKLLYPESERLSIEVLEAIFKTYYEGKKSIGHEKIPSDEKDRMESILKEMRMNLTHKEFN